MKIDQLGSSLVSGCGCWDAAEVSVFEAVAVSFECDDFGVVHEAVDHGGDDVVAEDVAPIGGGTCSLDQKLPASWAFQHSACRTDLQGEIALS